MFNKSKRIQELEQRLDAINAEVRYNSENIIACEKCKCLINKRDAIKGESIIINEFLDFSFRILWGKYPPYETVEKIHTPYYCLKCAPKEKQIKTKEKKDE